MDYYFVVLQLPGSRELKLTDDDIIRQNFWLEAQQVIDNHEAEIICVRQDTGVSDVLRQHFKSNGFSVYLLLHLLLTPDEAANKNMLYQHASEIISTANYEAIIDADENFQLIAVDRLDINNIKVNYNINTLYK